MKKTIMMFCMLMTLYATNMLAQEVRGIETRRAIYEGKSYELHYIYYGSRYDKTITLGTSSKYYGFEFSNLNSITVSVTIEVYEKNTDKLIDTKEVVLKSKEKYIHKYPVIQYYIENLSFGTDINKSFDLNRSDEELWNKCKENGRHRADEYYVKYKAFKLQ